MSLLSARLLGAHCVSVLAAAALLAACGAGSELRTLTIVAGGDVLLERPSRDGRPARAVGGDQPLEPVESLLLGADLAVVNLEQPLCDAPPVDRPDNGAVRLYAPRERARALAAAGIDAVSLANNHALDCGVAGLDTTLDTLGAAGVVAAGVDRGGGDPWEPLLLDVGDLRVALVAATLHPPRAPAGALRHAPVAVTAPNEAAEPLVRAVERAREAGADLVVVTLHWGVEGAATPRADQRRLAEALAQAGVDLLVGHGPHVVHPVETIDGMPVAYSLGNLVFDGVTDEERVGALLEVRFVVDGEGASVDSVTSHRVDAGGSQREGPE